MSEKSTEAPGDAGDQAGVKLIPVDQVNATVQARVNATKAKYEQELAAEQAKNAALQARLAEPATTPGDDFNATEEDNAWAASVAKNVVSTEVAPLKESVDKLLEMQQQQAAQAAATQAQQAAQQAFDAFVAQQAAAGTPITDDVMAGMKETLNGVVQNPALLPYITMQDIYDKGEMIAIRKSRATRTGAAADAAAATEAMSTPDIGSAPLVSAPVVPQRTAAAEGGDPFADIDTSQPNWRDKFFEKVGDMNLLDQSKGLTGKDRKW